MPMMLSELYGRIGQLLNEYGDAPIADIRQPFADLISPDMMYKEKTIKVSFCHTNISTLQGNIKLESYNVLILE